MKAPVISNRAGFMNRASYVKLVVAAIRWHRADELSAITEKGFSLLRAVI
jgi:hypothetical protein